MNAAKDSSHPTHLGRYFYLLVSLIFLLLMVPLAETMRGGLLVVLSLVLLSMCLAVIAVNRQRIYAVIAAVLATPALIMNALVFFGTFGLSRESPLFMYVAAPFFSFFWLFITFLILRAFLSETTFTRDKICGAVCVFLLIGISWTTIYLNIQYILPDSFYVVTPGMEPVPHITVSQALYFSFLTMATMGYGDVIPGNNLIRTVAYSQAVVGVLFIAVFIARVVSLYEQHRREHTGTTPAPNSKS